MLTVLLLVLQHFAVMLLMLLYSLQVGNKYNTSHSKHFGVKKMIRF